MPELERVIERAGFSEWDVDAATSGLCGTFAIAMKSTFPWLRLALVCLADENGQAKIARDGHPYWRHVVVCDGDRLFDVHGEVLLSDLVDNFCWNNPYGKGGALVLIEDGELLAMLCADGKSFDEGHLVKWIEQLKGASASIEVPQVIERAGPTASP